MSRHNEDRGEYSTTEQSERSGVTSLVHEDEEDNSTCSNAWSKFEKFTDGDGISKAKCKWCEVTYMASHGTKNLLRHLDTCPNREVNVDGSVVQFDQGVFRDMLARAIIKHNYTYSFVDHEATRELFSYLNPNVKHISRNTAKSDVVKVYEKEKRILKSKLLSLSSRICLTSNVWTSITTDHYMIVTAHYIDEDLKLHSKVLCFSYVPPPYSDAIRLEKLLTLLREWGIERKIFSITLDNASYNDSMIDLWRKTPSVRSSLLCDGQFFHVRCGAYVLNLIVQKGLKVINGSLHNIREAVKYVKATQERRVKFAECISESVLKTNKKVLQDVPTRWNSTYLMLEGALFFESAFSHLKLIDYNFVTCPSSEDWVRGKKIAFLLKPFYDISTLFSGVRHPTANLYFYGLWQIQLHLIQARDTEDEAISSMAKAMLKKFEKYWKCYSVVLSFAVILDPRYKLHLLEFCYSKLDMDDHVEFVRGIREKLYTLFDEYVTSVSRDDCFTSSTSRGNISVEGIDENIGDDIDEYDAFDENFGDDIDEYDAFESEHFGSQFTKSQLDLYLEENRLDRKKFPDLDVLDYWKTHSHRYPELSLMARDILSIPITTVASESAFSIGGRILNKYRSSLSLESVEAELCSRNWLFGVPPREDLDEESLIIDFQEYLH
ncbi:uncharacterized protein LOC104444289 [Eucalyptus grandis]|uniref:uncharacterized protein LOC104444289 n=1 Tax=Eucalyptus grandis TaxID=71139 RepID=UPI00192EC6FB|nr:uncharacterized protein LOC104444289 [Eucalyptus grandis]